MTDLIVNIINGRAEFVGKRYECLHGGTHLDEELQPRFQTEALLFAEGRDRDSSDQFHREIRPTSLRRAGVEDLADAVVTHQGQRLTFGREAVQRLVHQEERLIVGGVRDVEVVQRSPVKVSAVFDAATPARSLNQDAPHCLRRRRRRKELAPIRHGWLSPESRSHQDG